MSDFPVLKCFPVSDKLVKAWCPFCTKWHTHRYTDEIRNNKPCHRVAHCQGRNSPFKRTGGYRLEIMTTEEIKKIADSVLISDSIALSD